MKKSDSKPSPAPVPRVNSLLHRLQKAPGQKDESYLDELMLFLDNPPANSGDRWIKGAEMCAAWGITCSHTSVYRLFRSYAAHWRARVALDVPEGEELKPEILEGKASQLIAQRSCEMLTDPDSTPQALISLARLDLRKKSLEFARKKHEDSQRTPLQKAIVTLELNSFMNHEAQYAMGRLKEALNRPKRWPAMQEFLKKHGENPETFGFAPEVGSRPPLIPAPPPSSHAPHA
jgi:hypothetical protein